jgi:transposase
MTERAKYWARQMAAWKRSGLSQVEFCRREKIKGGTFAWWKRQLGKAGGKPAKRRGRPRKKTGRFVEVRLAGASTQQGYEVLLACGRSIRVPTQFDPQTLSRLITAVESC